MVSASYKVVPLMCYDVKMIKRTEHISNKHSVVKVASTDSKSGFHGGFSLCYAGHTIHVHMAPLKFF